MLKERIGRQTPTQNVTLPYTKTIGQEAVDLYNTSGRTAMPWQEALVFDIMAINNDNLWTHTRYGFSVSRRNGKNEIIIMRELAGLKRGERILHTAHLASTSHAAWERLYDAIKKTGIKIVSSYRARGSEHIEVEGGGYIAFRTRTSKGGLGEGYDLLVIDEAQEYQDDQESALKYIVTDSVNPQTILCGTPPTPISSGTVFTKFREQTLAGEKTNAGWAEWSIDKPVNPRDKEFWYETNPALGYHLKERDILDEIGDDETDFMIQRLGYWIKYSLKSAISEAEWNELKVNKLPEFKGQMFVGIKYAKDNTNVSVSICLKTEDGRFFVEGIDCRPIRAGTAWIIGFIKNADVRKVAVDGAEGQHILSADMEKARLKVPIMPTPKEIITANAMFEQAIYAELLCHMGQPSLMQSVSNCEHRAIGSQGGFGYKSLKEGIDVSLLESASIASWLAQTTKDKKKQRVRT